MPETVGYERESAHIEEIRKYRAKLEEGKQARSMTREEIWKQSEQQYRGHHWSEAALSDPTADLVTVNMSFSTVNTIVPYVTGHDPRFLVNPLSRDATVRNARIQQLLLNRSWMRPEVGARTAIKRSAVDLLVYGDGFGKVTFAIEDRLVPGQSASDTFQIDKVAQLYIDRISPWDIVIDPVSNGVDDARWVAHRILTTLEELEKDKRVDLPKDVRGTSLAQTYWTEELGLTISPEQGAAEDWVIVWEFYDKVNRILAVWIEGHEGEGAVRWVEEVEMPIVQMGNYPLLNSPYHMGDLEQLWSLQRELNKTRSEQMTHRRRNVSKVFVREQFLDSGAQAALQNPIINEIVKISGDVPLDDAVKVFAPQPLAGDAYALSDIIQRDIYEISGVNEYLRGTTPTIRKTATEASIIEGASNVKTRAKLDIIENGVRQLGELMLKIMKDVYPITQTDEVGMLVTGQTAMELDRLDQAEQLAELMDLGVPVAEAPQGVVELEVRPTEDVFLGIYEVEVEHGSTELRSPVFKEQRAREMAMALIKMAPALMQMGVMLNLRRALEEWFEAAGIVDVEGMFADNSGSAGIDPALMGQEPTLPATAQGVPNPDAAQAPLDPLSALNTGALLPE